MDVEKGEHTPLIPPELRTLSDELWTEYGQDLKARTSPLTLTSLMIFLTEKQILDRTNGVNLQSLSTILAYKVSSDAPISSSAKCGLYGLAQLIFYLIIILLIIWAFIIHAAHKG